MGMFDDLIPAQSGTAQQAPPGAGGMFDDLIPQQKPVTASGLYNAADIGLQEGVAGLAAAPRAIGTLGAQGIQGAANFVARQLGLPEDTRDLEKTKGAVELPTYESALATIQDPKGMFGGKPYTPQNVPEEYMRTLGQFAPNVPFGAVRGVIAPALASETAGQVFKGYGAEPYARAIAGLAGTVGATKAANTLAELRSFRGAPNLQELSTLVDNGYNAARASGVELHPTYVSNGLEAIAKDLTTGPNARSPRLIKETLGLLGEEAAALAPTPAQAPGAMAALTKVGPAAPAAKAPVDFTKLDALRRDLGEIARDFTNPTEAASARIAQSGIDKLLENAANMRGAVISGDANLLAQTARETRANAATEFRLRAIEALRTRALDQAAAANSGRNVENAFRQQMKGFVRPSNKGVSPAQAEGFSPEEIARIRQASRGASFPNALRLAGNALGGGGGIASGGLSLASVLTGDPRYAVAAGLGFGSRSLSNALMRQRAAQISRMIASRSPEAVARGVRPPPPTTGAGLPSAGLLSLLYGGQP